MSQDLFVVIMSASAGFLCGYTWAKHWKGPFYIGLAGAAATAYLLSIGLRALVEYL